MRRLAKAVGFPLERLDFRNESFPRLGMRELVFCPSAFDFPRSHPPEDAHFVESSVDQGRKDVGFDASRLSSNRPLIYAAVGSMAATMHGDSARKFITDFVAAMKRNPQWQAVLSTGTDLLDPATFDLPENVIGVRFAPQVELLKRASMMVCHGGLNSLKEAILLGVPLVVVPMFYDHFGYAARVEYHGLGRRVRMAELDGTGTALGAAMQKTHDDADVRAAIGRMAAVFQDLETRAPGAGLVEALLPR